MSTLRAFWATILSVTLCSCGLCGNDEIERLRSPEGLLEAVVFQRDCGATTGFSTQVSVLEAGANLANGSGNAFVADCDHGAAPAAAWGGPPVQLEWLGERHLRVGYDPRARVFANPNQVTVRLGWLSTTKVSLTFDGEVHRSRPGKPTGGSLSGAR